MTEASEAKAWQASASEVLRDMQDLGQRDEGRVLRPREQPHAGAQSALWKARRHLKELTPILGLATFMLERENLYQKPAKRKEPLQRTDPYNWRARLSSHKLPRAGTHVAIARYTAFSNLVSHDT